MLASGFTNAPLTRLLLSATIALALLATLTDTKPLLPIHIRPHLLDHHQYWRLATWQLIYTNSTEVLFASMTFYQLRIIERLWGSRKFGSFLLSTLPYTTLLPPLLTAALLRPLSLGHLNYLPSGPTPLLFALLAQYHAAIPYIYKYSAGMSGTNEGIPLSSKATSYILPMQLALSQLPGSAIAAGIGWIVGVAYRREVLPGAASWRVPMWVFGESEQKDRYDHLRRRMEGDAGRATGVEENRNHARRRDVVGGLADQFRGAQ